MYVKSKLGRVVRVAMGKVFWLMERRVPSRFLIALLFIFEAAAENKFISQYVFEWCDTPAVVENYLSHSLRNPDAAYILGNLYLFGIGVEKNLRKADIYITMAANRGLPEALNSIGDGYYSGDIRPLNHDMALKHYRRAADMGFGAAQFNAGVVLMRNARSAEELKLAIFYLDKASKNRKDLSSMTAAAEKYKRNAEQKLRHYKKGIEAAR